MAGSATFFDLITMGRIGVDLHPNQSGMPEGRVETFGNFLGGSAANVAIATARLGHASAVITRTGADPFGVYLHRQLREFGVDDRWVTSADGLSGAPDPSAHTDELDYFAIRAARIFWITGTALSGEPSRSATLAALKARGRTSTTVFDLDWRPALWHSTTSGHPDEARPYYAEALRHATVAVGNLDECEIATGVRDPRACAEALLAAGVELAVVKLGPKGVLAVHRDGTAAEVPPIPVRVVNGLGTGDAFGGALCHGLLLGWELEPVLRYANAAGALVASRPACSSAMPTGAEVEGLLAGDGKAPAPERSLP
ncbi:PfkB family carbohydrate kinase [Streptomyces resistomycificus]|uniref:5-dehydro-2-deoxygluconokinase n=1 Tax=Streptomyces resistomycificus TaxID=67356 RepID=A0A0L8L860_9ACTN|nr:PfkB family carbohydrate kinase [Streptomyces resistomycificus]KOG34305.1 5-dehydro-2-deoxygluconokinase [Streptomyces resistomycificus]KUO01763.1 5-dehydro-2-deoxygluconokinase [Streptomyces resistomycificus]